MKKQITHNRFQELVDWLEIQDKYPRAGFGEICCVFPARGLNYTHNYQLCYNGRDAWGDVILTLFCNAERKVIPSTAHRTMDDSLMRLLDGADITVLPEENKELNELRKRYDALGEQIAAMEGE